MIFLKYPKLQPEIGDKQDEINDLMIQVQEANDLATHILTEYGYWGELLKLIAKQEKELEKIKNLNSKERVEALANASTHGQKFYATHGDNFMSMCFFRASELKKSSEH